MKVLFFIIRWSVVICLSSGFTVWQAAAEPYLARSAATQLVISNAQQAARLVKGQYGGKVLKVQRSKVNGNPGYKVKILKNNGHVVSVKVDAKSGRISGK